MARRRHTRKLSIIAHCFFPTQFQANRLANAGQHHQVSQIRVLDMALTEVAEKPEGGRHGAECVFRDALPCREGVGYTGDGVDSKTVVGRSI